MYVSKKLRQQKLLSGEQVAEKSGLSLRTIQRVERGHRVEYASLRASGSGFGVVRKGNWSGTEKGSVERVERFFFSAFLLCFFLWFSNFALGLPVLSKDILSRIGNIGNLLGVIGLLQLLAAYLASYYIRVGDKHELWFAWSLFNLPAYSVY